jgi:hypothetical protein
MSINQENPLSIKALGTILTPSVEKQVEELYELIKQGSDTRQDWVNKQEKLIRQRKGVRKKKIFPWPGANNHSWPLTDGIIRRWKPNIVALIMQSDPVAYFFPNNPEAVKSAPDAQAYYSWRFQSMRNVRESSMELADYVAQTGTAYTRQGWDYRTRRQCRVIDAQNMFPDGVDAAVERYNEGIRQLRADTEDAIARGEIRPESMKEVPEPMTPEAFVAQTLLDEYDIDPARSENEAAQVEAITKAILDGAPQVKLYYHTVTSNKIGWQALSPLNVIVPPRTEDITDADFIAIEYNFTPDDIQKMALDGYFRQEAAQELAAKIQANKTQKSDATDQVFGAVASRSTIFQLMDQADGIKTPLFKDDKRTPVLEVYCKLDIDDDGLLEKCVLWYHPDTKTILALYPYPYPFEEWPVIRFQFEHNSQRPYESRGIAELCSVFQSQVNKLHNARLDAIQVTLSPMYQMRSANQDVNRSIRFMPGSIIPVQNIGDLAPLVTDIRPLSQLLQEENFTKIMAEQYIGIFDPSVLSQNASERRTATEVEAVVQQTQSIFGQDASLFQSSMQRVHQQLWQLEQEFGPPEIHFRVTGEENPRLATKAELSFNYDIVPAGTPANTSKQLAMARSREAMQLFVPDQSGLINKHELYKWYFDVLDRNMGKLILRSPEQAAAIQQMMALLEQQNKQQGGQPGAVPATP